MLEEYKIAKERNFGSLGTVNENKEGLNIYWTDVYFRISKLEGDSNVVNEKANQGNL